MAIIYTDKVIKHFTNPQNVGIIKDPSGIAMEGSPACGDMVSLTIKVNDETKVIEDVKFKSYGCASNIATSSMMTQMAIGKTIDEAKKILHKDITDELGGLPNIKVHCSVLAVDTLKGAIKDYETKKGILKEDVDAMSVANIRLRLKSVINPATGVDIITSNIVTSYKIDSDGKIVIGLKLCPKHEYAENIVEEIEEHISTLKDYNGHEVKFNCEIC